MADQRSEANRVKSTWLGRTHFSRSICYRVDNCSISQLPFLSSGNIFDDDLTFKTNPIAKLFPELTQEEWALLLKSNAASNSQRWPSNGLRRSLSFTKLGTEANTNRTRSAGNSPSVIIGERSGHFRSLSLPGRGEASDDEGQNMDGEDFEVKRAASWSEYFATSGGEHAVETAEEWMVDLSQLFLGHKFASGAYSRLYHGIYKDKAVAVKVVRLPDDNEEVARRLDRQFRGEVNVLSRVHHANVVEFIAACRKPPVCCIITEYLPQGSLRAFLHKRAPHSLPSTLVIKMALDIARGMEYLHSQGVIHRDLKSENLVLADDFSVKITDFGVAFFEVDCPSMMEDLGTYRWMAPEMISNKPYSRKVDVYSFGIVLWELLTGQIPFEEMTAVQAAFAVVHKHARPVIPPDCQGMLAQLMQQCWSTNPDRRPDFPQVIEALEEIKESSELEMSFTGWQMPHKHTNLFLRFFTGCVSKSALQSPHS